MAKAQLDILLDKLQGRLTGDSEFYVTNRYGKTIISNYPMRKDPKKISAHQRANSDAFRQAVKQCRIEMSNPDRLAYWQEHYAAYTQSAGKDDKHYSTLRGFIIAQLSNQQKETN